MSLWLFNIFMDGFMRKMKAEVENVDAKLNGVSGLGGGGMPVCK